MSLIKVAASICILAFCQTTFAAEQNNMALIQQYSQAAAEAQNKGNYLEAEKYHRRVLEEINAAPSVYPSNIIALQMTNLASVLNLQNKSKEAEKLLNDAIRILQDSPNVSESQYALLYANLANCQQLQNNLDGAEKNYLKALSIFEKDTNNYKLFIADIKSGLAYIWMQRGKYSEARQYYHDALTVLREQGITNNNPALMKTEEEYKTLLQKIGNKN